MAKTLGLTVKKDPRQIDTDLKRGGGVLRLNVWNGLRKRAPTNA
ncbi:hypothetical protein [Paenibacillus sp. 7516]|nr:hypothetical protein [Paenibacillus sp. 7516]